MRFLLILSFKFETNEWMKPYHYKMFSFYYFCYCVAFCAHISGKFIVMHLLELYTHRLLLCTCMFIFLLFLTQQSFHIKIDGSITITIQGSVSKAVKVVYIYVKSKEWWSRNSVAAKIYVGHTGAFPSVSYFDVLWKFLPIGSNLDIFHSSGWYFAYFFVPNSKMIILMIRLLLVSLKLNHFSQGKFPI